jgi:hypothetical protein
MGLFSQGYLKPGVYTDAVTADTSISLFGTARVPVIIGEGLEYFTYSNEELFRGSSAVADNPVTGENESDQVTGTNNTFQVTYFPIVTGTGQGIVTSDPTLIQVQVNGIPAVVSSLNGTLGQFTLQAIPPVGSTVTVSYYFKRTDTYVLNENDTFQVPAFASLTVQTGLVITAGIPGYLGNNVTIAFTLAEAGSGVSDLLAVTGAGTNAISIELMNSTNAVRTLSQVAALINAGVPTLEGGYLAATVSSTYASTAGVVLAASHLAGGAGQSTNMVFKVQRTPIVDGTNGGVVTTNPSDVSVLVNGVPATVTAVAGSTGLVTLATGVAYGKSLEITYYTNTYQDTTDLLPSQNVSSITMVGLAPGSSDYIEGTDFVLSGANSNLISWGASVSTTAGAGSTSATPFNSSVVTTTLVDNQVYLVPVTGVVNGVNSVFTLPTVPVDGSGLDRATDIPSLISVYVGTTPIAAMTAGAVRVAQLSGDSGTVTLYNPPASGQNVYASYYSSILNDHTFTLTVVNPGLPGQGTYTVTDELNQICPSVTLTASNVTDGTFTNTGVVYPNNFSDAFAQIGAVDEVVTLTFQNDGLGTITPAVQASVNIQGLNFMATTPGTAANALTITFVGGTAVADDLAVTVNESAISVDITANGGGTRTLADIITLFTGGVVTTTAGGAIICTAANGTTTSTTADAAAATAFAGGAAQIITNPYANRYVVSSSVTNGSSGVGYLGQTYIDAVTGFTITIVDPSNALPYGYVQNPSPTYTYQPGDSLTYTVSSETPFVTGSTPIIALPGLWTKVVSTYGMTAGETALVQTFGNAGSSPNVGEYYYVSYTVDKLANDPSYGLMMYSTSAAAYANYGQPSLTNRLSLGVSLLLANGATQFGCIQVPTQPGSAYASDASFTAAIQLLAMNLPGGTNDQKAGVIVPLSTSATVQQYLSRFLTIQAGPRYKGEAQGFIGFGQFTTANQIAATAQSIANKRVIAVDPVIVGINVTASDGTVTEYAVTGEFVAAALAGLALSPSNDVATSLLLQDVVGFTGLLAPRTDTVMDQLATAGVTVLTNNNGALSVRDYLTTDQSSTLNAEPYTTTSVDAVRQAFRANLKQFIGQKQTASLITDITVVCNELLKAFVADEILTSYANLVVVQDADNPTLIDITVSVQPIFALKYISIVFSVSTSSGTTTGS